MIRLHNISKRYIAANHTVSALTNIDLSINKGEIFGVIGKSGAGKSTLIRCINFLEKPTSGSVIIDNEDLQTLSAAQLRRVRQSIGMIFQHFNLLHSQTVFSNIALPLTLIRTPPAQIQQRVTQLLDYVGLTDRADAYPAQLSGGQKQRVAIARALATQPKILLCDEATSSLDPNTTTSILQLLKKINQELGLTIVLITHEMDVLKAICDRVAVIDGGEIVEQSTTTQLFRQPQSAIARDFLSTTMKERLPDELAHQLSATQEADHFPLVRIHFFGSLTTQPILTDLIRRFDASISILLADVEYVRGEPVGSMSVEIISSAQTFAAITEHLRNLQLPFEILGYVRRDLRADSQESIR